MTVKNFVKDLEVSFALPTLSSTNTMKTFEMEEVDWCLGIKLLINIINIRGKNLKINVFQATKPDIIYLK